MISLPELSKKIANALDTISFYPLDQRLFLTNNGKTYSNYEDVFADIRDEKLTAYLEIPCFVGEMAWRQVEPLFSPEIDAFLGINVEDYLEFNQWLEELGNDITEDYDEKEGEEADTDFSS